MQKNQSPFWKFIQGRPLKGNLPSHHLQLFFNDKVASAEDFIDKFIACQEAIKGLRENWSIYPAQIEKNFGNLISQYDKKQKDSYLDLIHKEYELFCKIIDSKQYPELLKLTAHYPRILPLIGNFLSDCHRNCDKKTVSELDSLTNSFPVETPAIIYLKALFCHVQLDMLSAIAYLNKLKEETIDYLYLKAILSITCFLENLVLKDKTITSNIFINEESIVNALLNCAFSGNARASFLLGSFYKGDFPEISGKIDWDQAMFFFKLSVLQGDIFKTNSSLFELRNIYDGIVQNEAQMQFSLKKKYGSQLDYYVKQLGSALTTIVKGISGRTISVHPNDAIMIISFAQSWLANKDERESSQLLRAEENIQSLILILDMCNAIIQSKSVQLEGINLNEIKNELLKITAEQREIAQIYSGERVPTSAKSKALDIIAITRMVPATEADIDASDDEGNELSSPPTPAATM